MTFEQMAARLPEYTRPALEREPRWRVAVWELRGKSAPAPWRDRDVNWPDAVRLPREPVWRMHGDV